MIAHASSAVSRCGSRVATAMVRRTASAATTTTTTTTTTITTATTPAARAAFSSTSAARSAGHHHESPYDAPTGWLFGVKPGEKYKNEGWEKPMFWGFCGSLILFAAIIPFKPDTSIQTWALEEARRRLEAEGILADPFPEKK